MRNRYTTLGNENRFTDLASCQFFRPPDQLIRAADIAVREIIESADLYLPATGEPGCRPVIFEDSNGVKWYVELTPYVHPVGAADVVIGSIAYAADGTATYTPILEGRGLEEDGTLIDSDTGATPLTMAGWLFTDYFTHVDDNIESREHFRVTTIAEGDFLWLIRRGRWEVYTEAAAAVAGSMLKISNTTGAVEECAAFDATTAATIGATLPGHIVSGGGSFGLAVGRVEVLGVANLAVAELLLPPRFSR